MASDLRAATSEVNLSLTWQVYRAKAAQPSDPIINELQHMRGRVAYGNGRHPQLTPVGAYASLNTMLDASDVLLGMANTAGLNAGQSRNVARALNTPSTWNARL